MSRRLARKPSGWPDASSGFACITSVKSRPRSGSGRPRRGSGRPRRSLPRSVTGGPPMSYPVPGGRMIKLDHLTIAVTNSDKSRDWYIETLGLKLEFEIPERRTSAVQDEFGFTLFLAETPGGPGRPSCVLTFQVSDVEAKHRQLVAAGVQFVHPPQKTFWGYGADLKDPDGYHIWLWDEKTMREKGEV